MAVDGLDLNDTLGSFLSGVIVAALLLGMVCSQAWSYFNESRKDKWYLQILVGAVVLGNVLHQIFICHALYTYAVIHYGEPQYLASMPWSFIAMSYTGGFISCIVQSFYVWRVWLLSKKNYILALLLEAVCIAQLGLNIAMLYKAARLTSYTMVVTLNPIIKAFNALGAAADCLIAGAMVVLLMRQRTGFHGTNTMISKLVVYCVNTGIFTSVAAILTIVMIAVYPNTMLDHPFYFSLGRLYALSLLGMLNARSGIRGHSSPSTISRLEEVPISLTSVPVGGMGMGSRGPESDRDGERERKGTFTFEIHQTRTVVTDADQKV